MRLSQVTQFLFQNAASIPVASAQTCLVALRIPYVYSNYLHVFVPGPRRCGPPFPPI